MNQMLCWIGIAVLVNLAGCSEPSPGSQEPPDAGPTDPILVRGSDGWDPLGVEGAPPSRYLPGVAYDKQRHVLVVFGGGDPTSDKVFADTWEFDGTSWS